MLKHDIDNENDKSWQQRPLVLSLAGFNDKEFEWIEDAWEALDIRICSVKALIRRDPQTWRLKLAALIHTCVMSDLTAQNVLAQIDRATWANELWFVAVNPCGDYVGMTVLSQHPLITNGYCARLTGVVSAYRRQNMATVLKVHALRVAMLTGAKLIETSADNDLLELNLRLGFRV
ncbi:MAG: hypothetical protein ACPG8W_21815 [Candidatus Promineifilaceae bacterium]